MRRIRGLVVALLVVIVAIPLGARTAQAATSRKIFTDSVIGRTEPTTPGAKDVVAYSFTVRTKRGIDTFKALTLEWRGSAATPSTDVDEVRLHSETDGVSGFGPSDTELVTASVGTGTLITLDPSDVPFTFLTLYVVIDVAPTAPIGDVIDFRIRRSGIVFSSGRWPPAREASASWDPSGAAAIVRLTADLRVSTEDSPDPVVRGDTVTYTVTVLNDGPDRAPGALMVFWLPEETTLQSVSGPGTCTGPAPGGDFLTCRFTEAIAVASESVWTTITETTPSTDSLIGAKACVSSDASDPESGDDCEVEFTQVV